MTPEQIAPMLGQTVEVTLRSSARRLNGKLLTHGDRFAIQVQGGNLRPFTAPDVITCAPSA